MNRDQYQPFANQPPYQPPPQNPPSYQGYQGQPGGYQGAPGSYQQSGGYAPYQPPPKKKSAWPKILGFGCLGLVILMIVGVVVTIYLVKSWFGGVVEEYTSPAPAALPALALSDEEIKDAQDRAQAFAVSLEAGQPAQPLILTADEINALIQNHPDWKNVEGKLYVVIEDDLLTGKISIPMEQVFPLEMVKGRYLNGAATFDVYVRNGMLHVYMKNLVVNDQPVPQNFMQSLGTENMAKDTNTKNPEAAEFFNKIESLEIKDGKIIITPKP